MNLLHLHLLHPVAFPVYNLRSVPHKEASPLTTPRTATRLSWNYCNKGPLHASFSLSKPGNRSSFACQATTEAEPESNYEKNKDASVTPESSNLKNSLDRIDSMLRAPDSIQNKDEPAAAESSGLKDSIERIDGVLKNPVERTDDILKPPDSIQKKDDEMEVASGSPLPGIKQVGEPIMIPKATIDILKDQVFGFDTFFVTSQEPYEQGVLFKGNLRWKAAKSFEKITKRMQDRFEDQYRLFLFINPEDDEPVAVVVPKQTLQPESTAVPEWFAAGAFGLVTIFTLLLRNVPALQSNLLSTFDNLELLKDGFPGALVTVLVLGIHEIGHILVARDIGAKLGVPYFVPSWQKAYVIHWVRLDRFSSIEDAYQDGKNRLERLVATVHNEDIPRLSAGSVKFHTRQFGTSLKMSSMTSEEYKKAVMQAKEHILAGDIFQIVLSQRFERRTFADPFEVYRALRIVNPSPYMTYLQARGCILVSSSPEILTQVKGRKIVNRPLAGTVRRGRTDTEDKILEQELLNDEKQCAGHIMLVDLGCNDVGKVSKPGSVKVEKLMNIERYSHVMHISSTVTGELFDHLTCWDVLRAALPVGTVSGAPKVKAMELIDQLEVTRRGPYSGGFGGVSFSADMDIAIALRTIVFPTQTRYDTMYSYKDINWRQEWVAHLQAGAGIVADSNPDDVQRECENKAAALARAIDLAESTFVDKV